MKLLLELMPDPTDVLDPLATQDTLNSVKTPMNKACRQGRDTKHGSGDNMKTAKRIAARVKLRKKENADRIEDTPSQPSFGGHFSSFLFR